MLVIKPEYLPNKSCNKIELKKDLLEGGITVKFT